MIEIRLTMLELALPQDIVTAHEHFNIEDFVQQFQESLKVTAPRKRAFLLSWMQARPPLSCGTLQNPLQAASLVSRGIGGCLCASVCTSLDRHAGHCCT